MLDQVTRTWAALNRHWAGRLFGAMLLPGWLLILASAEHGSPSVSSVAAPMLSGVVLFGGLMGAGLGLWSIAKQKQTQARKLADQPEQTRLQNLLNLIGGAVFLAACYLVVFDFDAFSRPIQDRHWLGSTKLPSWDTLLILCAIQFAFFFAQASVARRS